MADSPPALVDDAACFAREKHAGQVRKYSGEAYFNHPWRVARLVAGYGFDDTVIAAALLHDVIEDCGVTWDELAGRFGEPVVNLVLEVSDVSMPCDGGRAARKAIDREHLSKASPAGQAIKLADLIDNTRDIVKHDPAFAKVYLAEKWELLQVLNKPTYGLRERAFDAWGKATSELEERRAA